MKKLCVLEEDEYDKVCNLLAHVWHNLNCLPYSNELIKEAMWSVEDAQTLLGNR